MEEYTFTKLYNANISMKIDYSNPIKSSLKINKLFSRDGFRVEIKQTEFLNNEIRNTLCINDKSPDLYSITRIISLIRTEQIFFDGNTRTSLIFFKLLMNKYFPNFQYFITPNNNDHNDFFDIIFRDDTYSTSEERIENIHKYIK